MAVPVMRREVRLTTRGGLPLRLVAVDARSSLALLIDPTPSRVGFAAGKWAVRPGFRRCPGLHLDPARPADQFGLFAGPPVVGQRVDATGTRDAEMHPTRKGNQWYFW